MNDENLINSQNSVSTAPPLYCEGEVGNIGTG